jgi:hypothetical protein
MKAQTESRNAQTVKIFQEKQKPTSVARKMILPKVYMRKSKRLSVRTAVPSTRD